MTVTINGPANAAASGGSTGANPTASVGLSAVNGVATTFLRSDGAPALSQAIVPTWTAAHTFQQAVAATSTDGVVLSTSATATSGNQKFSPALRFTGSGWGTTGSAAQACEWRFDVQPVQGTNPTNVLAISYSKNGGGWTNAFKFGDENGAGGAAALFVGSGKIRDEGSGQLKFFYNTGSNVVAYMAAGGFQSVGYLCPGDGSNLRVDAAITRAGAGSIAIGTTTAGDYSGTLTLTSVIQKSANAAQWIQGQASELLTLSTSGTTTDTSANLLPANSIIEAVVARVTTTITTATDWKLGDPTTAGRFTAANATMTAGTTDVGLLHWSGAVTTLAAGPSQSAAAKVRVTTTGTPGAGAIRITVFYRQFVAPTS